MTPRTRRDVLRASALAALAVPLAACQSGYSDEPDPLAPLAEQARADADAARAVSGDLAQQVAAARTAHAQAIQAEVDRLNRPKSAVRATTPAETGMAGLRQRLATARKQAENLVATLPRYRAGLAAAVAAGCAGLQQVSDQLGPGEDPGTAATAASRVPDEAIEPLQKALAAEHAAVWVYSLVSAFLPSNFDIGVSDGSAEHQGRRDVCVRMLTAAGATPDAPEPAYLTPKPVTDAASAKTVVAAAEADAAAAWRGVLERTDDAGLRLIALRALLGSARRGTRWRQAAGESPAAVAMPGAQPS
ncbi:MAG TPA: ferritin-like domain-containing protein [Amycolatopsis sp.]|uniref:ferritin-like domain-containing protein n=1 Tax=Amycolatopsis sp. TaxID=37632 RepID=UPI002B4A7311|nr:ferritin-like domain-containing protein [Amycolatopsis sp.]HKS48531.1 ferritin-like domain-containing protein [Amycolatopsis sp.]